MPDRSQDATDTGIQWSLALVLVLVALLALPTVSTGQEGDGGGITTGDADADALISEIERVTADFVEAREQLGSDRLDPDALLDSIGRDPEGIVAWMIDETRWLPYAGALRGPRGVLLDRSGSSLDRALLLADLLERTGLEVRLANSTLPEATAAAMAAAELGRPWTPASEPAYATADEIADHRASVRSAAEELASAVGLLDGPIASGPRPDEAIADHWWVQVSSDGQWDDVDLLFGGDADARPDPTSTFVPSEVPAELHHRVTVRIVIERHENGAVIEAIPLEHAIPLGTDEAMRSIELDFGAWVPQDLVDRSNETDDPIEAARIAGAWLPRLRIAGRTETGEWFGEHGRVEPPKELAQADALSDALEGIGGLGSDPAEEEVIESSLTAAWIEYETAGPGLEPRIERRELLDLIGPSRHDAAAIDPGSLASDDADLRRGLAFLGETAILLQAAATHPDALLDAYLETWIELRPALIALVFLGAGIDDDRIGPSLASPGGPALGLVAITSARDRWAGSAAAYIGRPQVWSLHRFFDAQSEAATTGRAVDIVTTDVDVLPTADVDPRLLRLERGILDTLVEHELGVTGDSFNTWDRFARRGEEGVAWRTLRPGDVPDAGLVDGLPPVDLERIRAALARGDSVVVASEPRLRGTTPFAEWWRISDDGTALGLGLRGWGTAAERTVVTQPSMRTLELAKDAKRVEDLLAEYRAVARAARARGQLDPYGHLRHRLAVDPFAETQPIIAALADTLPFIIAL